MNSPLISVIVPVYKVEAYLTECVKSIIRQTYTKLEVILVDDGSPDRCPQICDQLTSEDSRITVIHKSNGGLSDARNTGIKIASGEYIIFIDSDDFWSDQQFLSKLINCAKTYPKADLIFFGRTIYNGDKIIPRNFIDNSKVNGQSLYDGMKYLLQSNELLTSACMKLIRTSIIKDNNIYFKKGMLSEDLDWSLNLYQHIGAIAAINNNSYGYRKHTGSISTSLSPKHADDLIWFIEKWANKPANDKLQDLNLNFIAFSYCGMLAVFNQLPKDKRNYIKKKLLDFGWLLNYTLIPKVKKVSLCHKLLGFNLTCTLLQTYYKRKKL